MTEEKQENHEVIQKEGKSPYFWIRLASILAIIITWIILIGLKYSMDISLKIPLAVSIIITIFGIFALIGTTLFNKKEEEKDNNQLRKPITIKEAKEMVYKIVEERWDHIRQPESEGILEITTETGEKGDQVYKFKIQPLYGEQLYIIINATYPDTMPTITKVEETKNPTVNKLVNAKFQSPKETDTTEEIIENPMTGIKKITKKTVTKKKEEDKKEEELV